MPNLFLTAEQRSGETESPQQANEFGLRCIAQVNNDCGGSSRNETPRFATKTHPVRAIGMIQAIFHHNPDMYRTLPLSATHRGDLVKLYPRQ